jgi:hypothetical protein
MVAASLVCGGTGGTVSASTTGFMLTAAGNAEIEANLTMPASCAAPVILIRNFNAAGAPGAQLGVFIALSGLSASSMPAGHNDEDMINHY